MAKAPALQSDSSATHGPCHDSDMRAAAQPNPQDMPIQHNYNTIDAILNTITSASRDEAADIISLIQSGIPLESILISLGKGNQSRNIKHKGTGSCFR